MSTWTRDELVPRPNPYSQTPTLFPVGLERFVVEMRVSADEMLRWQQMGWLSFNPYEMDAFDWGEGVEVQFVKGLARSGMSDDRISDVLASLSRPYRYYLSTTFFSFAENCWVMLPAKPELSMDDEIETLIRNQDWEALREIQSRIEDALSEEDE